MNRRFPGDFIISVTDYCIPVSCRKNQVILLFIFFLIDATGIRAQSIIPERGNQKIKVKPVADIQAYAFNLADVQLLQSSPFKNAMDKDAAYLLLLEPDRLLHRFYTNAGLPAKAPVYGGWESEGLSGHMLGHYLSACSLMYAAAHDKKFKERVDYIVAELARCQQARHTGYVGAIPNEDSIFGKLTRGVIKSSGFDLNGGWSPWYTVHKLMAGLLDAYLYCDNTLALKVVTGMADWADNILKHLSPAQVQKMLRCEYGGMNDVLANLYAVSGNKKYLDLAYLFHDDFVMDSLAKEVDPLPGKHSNTNVPKAIGCARLYELNGRQADKTIASFFWKAMTEDHTYVIGGNSNYEYCTAPKQLNDHLSDNTCETCNTYNMLKLTRHLFCWQPNSRFADFYERALYNHILASQDPANGMMCYFVPLRMGTHKSFSDSFNTFTCCVGSGMENHSKYAESIYYEGKDGSLFINLFIPSVLSWRSKGVTVRQETTYPESDHVRVIIQTKMVKAFSVKIRWPWWARNGMRVAVNGKEIPVKKDEHGYVSVSPTWKNNDTLDITMPMNLYAEPMPDNDNRVALLYGPVVLAGQLGKQMPDPVYGIPVLLTANRDPQAWIKTISRDSLDFEIQDIAKPGNVTLIPFYKTSDNYYSVYWDYFTPVQWTARQEEYEQEKKRQRDIDERTIDNFRIGEMQPERDHHLQAGERSYVSDALGINGREARSGDYFSFTMKVQPEIKNSLLFTYLGDDKNRKFDILVDGQKLVTEDWKGGAAGKFYSKEYPVPGEWIAGKTTITIRIEANYGTTAGRIFGCRVTRN